MALKLISNGPVSEIILTEKPLVIGSSPECDIRVEHLSVSARHCQISLLGSLFSVRDFSEGRLLLNGDKVEQGYLYEGDVLRLGDLDFMVTGQDGAMMPEAASTESTEEISAIKKIPLGGDEPHDIGLQTFGLEIPREPEMIYELFCQGDKYKPDKKMAEMLFGGLVAISAVSNLSNCFFYGHSERVCQLALLLADEIDLDSSDRIVLGVSALLHDIGKSRISVNIWQKVDALTAHEWSEIKRHPILGERILQRLSGTERIARTVRHHHERFDGNGYPDGLKGGDIPLLSRILSIVDAFESMIYPRPWRKPLTKKQAVDELKKCSITQFDRKLVESFIKVLKSGKLRFSLVFKKK